MVNRFSKNEIAIFDLDGTLLKVNSYKVFLLLWFFWLIAKGKTSILMDYSSILWNRLIKGTLGRIETKALILKLYSNNSDSLFESWLLKFLFLLKRKQVFSSLNKLQGNYEVILATAAYCFYARPLAAKFKIKKVICTTLEDMNVGKECIGVEKVNRLKDLYGIDKFKYLYTDHSDDLPLIENSEISFIVNPSKKSKFEICHKLNCNKANIHFI